jgi:copper chaperone CopZ
MGVARIHVAGISCEGCARVIAKALQEVRGVASVNVDVTTKVVTVSHSASAPITRLLASLRKAGYPPGAHVEEP